MAKLPRWDPDERGEGIADARPLLPAVERLAAAMKEPGWVAEQAFAHLLPHLRTASGETPFQILGAQQLDDGVYELEVSYAGERDSVSLVRDGARWLAAIAENSFHLRQVDEGTLECVTGVLEGDSQFASHGHTLRIRVK